MKTLFYIVRHGQSVANLQKVFAGTTDFLLTDLGIEQAKITAKVLEKVPFSAIYSSPLARARKTAEPHGEYHHLPIQVVDDLQEIYVGEWEAVSHAEIMAKYPDLFPDKWESEYATVTLPGGENVAAAGMRFQKALTAIAEKNAGKTVCIVTHAGILRAFWGNILGLAPKDVGGAIPFATNASYSVVAFEDGVFTPIIYSVDDELRKAGIVTAVSYT